MKKISLLCALMFSSLAFADKPADLTALNSQQLYEEVELSKSSSQSLVSEASRSLASNPTWSKEDQAWLKEFQQIISEDDPSI